MNRSIAFLSVSSRSAAVLLILLLSGCLSQGVAVAADTKPAPRLPASSLSDFSDKLETPAGKRGFLGVGDDGHFHWMDGTRARFWGINVSSTRLDIPDEQIEQVVTTFARAGLNLVRLEAIDNRNCLFGKVDAPDSQRFDTHYLDRLDRWMDALRRHGLYYYLDLLDFRTFKAGDGVLNANALDRGARPYAVFDRYLIQLQKDYAARLLTHRNPYSHLSPVEDPALALVEICNEHGFFLYPEKLETLVEPYRTDLRNRWNQWLRERYPMRDQLAAAWGKINETSALRDDEDPNRQSVDLPLLTPRPPGQTPPNEIDVRRAPARQHDGVQFLSELQRAYFHEMRQYVQELGLRVPVTAVVSNDIVPDLLSVAQTCDFTSENWYGDNGDEDARAPGVRYYANRNTLRDDGYYGFAPYTASLHWNKPVVLREWATPWPNRYRAASVPEALAYAALQDYDAILLFGYQCNRALNGAEADALNEYSFQCDPTVWGLYALAGRAFLNGAIRPAINSVTLSYPPSRLYAWPNGNSDLQRAAWCVRLNNAAASAADKGCLTPTHTLDDLKTLHALLDRLGKQRGLSLIGDSLAAGIWRSDTGQITRTTREGRLEIQTPVLRVLAGEFEPGRIYSLGGDLRFFTQTGFGALMALSLDGKPIEQSRHLVVKMVTRAENTGELLEKSPPGATNAYRQRALGTAPVLTFGRSAAKPTRLWTLGKPAGKGKPKPPDRELLILWMVDGTWELEIHDGKATLACDTPNVSGLMLGHSITTTGTPIQITTAEQPPVRTTASR